MAVTLITGMSGTGKSTVLRELARRGHRVVDLDDEGWSVEVPTGDGGDLEQVWDEDRVGRLLAESGDTPLVVSGCASNQGRFYDRLATVVLLSAPAEVMLQRIATRDTNRFGKEPHERGRILQDLAEIEPLLRATSTVELDASRPLAEVVDAVEELLRDRAG